MRNHEKPGGKIRRTMRETRRNQVQLKETMRNMEEPKGNHRNQEKN